MGWFPCGCAGCTCRDCSGGTGSIELEVEILSTVADNSCVTCSNFEGVYTLDCEGEIFDVSSNFLYCQWAYRGISECSDTYDLILKSVSSGGNHYWLLELQDSIGDVEASFDSTPVAGLLDCAPSTAVALSHLGGLQTACAWGGSSATVKAP